MDYKTANDTHIEKLQIFLDKNNILLRDIKYCEYEQKYFNHEVKDLEVSQLDDSWTAKEVEVMEWIPSKYNNAFAMLNKEFEVVNTTTNIKYAVEEQYELE